MANEIFEIVVNLAEPILLFVLLKGKMDLKRRALPFAIVGIIVLAAATTIMNKLQLDYLAVIFINLVLYMGYSLLLFKGDHNLRAVWPSLMVYIIVFSNTILYAIMALVSAKTIIASLQPTALRILVQTVYVAIMLLMVILVLKFTKHMDRVSSKLATGALLSCLASIGVMYLLLEITIAAAETGISTGKNGLIAFLMMTVVVVLLVMFGQTNKWARKYSEERIISESLKREVQYNSEIETIALTVRQLKHDYSNHISVIASLTADGDIDGLRKYMDDYSSEYGSIDRYAITGDNMLDSLLSYKRMICDAERIDLRVSALGENMSTTGLSAVELSSLFGNLIDNAINACKKLEPEKRLIILSIRKMADMMSIRIENERVEEPQRPDQDEKHGLGLPRIKSIVEAHNGICTIMPDKDRFTVEILLPTANGEETANEA